MKRKRWSTLLLAGILLLTGCRSLDVIGTSSVESFGALLEAIPAEIQGEYWMLQAPNREARFLWSRDFSPGEEYNALLEVTLAPFLDAGLDMDLLPDGMVRGDSIVLGTKLDVVPLDGGETPLESYQHLLWNSPGTIGHHMAMDHFGVDLGGGHQFEFARDMGDNDKDMVFVLDPEPFRQAGADLDNIPGWVFDQVETMDHNGATVMVEKLLLPFDLQ